MRSFKHPLVAWFRHSRANHPAGFGSHSPAIGWFTAASAALGDRQELEAPSETKWSWKSWETKKNRAETNEINNRYFFYQIGPFKSKSLPLWSFPIIRLESSKAPSEIPNQMNKNNNLNYPLAWYNPNCDLGGSTSRKNRNGTAIEQRHFLIWIKTASTIMIYQTRRCRKMIYKYLLQMVDVSTLRVYQGLKNAKKLNASSSKKSRPVRWSLPVRQPHGTSTKGPKLSRAKSCWMYPVLVGCWCRSWFLRDGDTTCV